MLPSGGGSRASAPVPKSRPKSQSKSSPAPRRTGVFARPLGDVMQPQVRQQHEKVRKAEQKVPGQTVNVSRIPHGTLTPQSRQALRDRLGAQVRKDVADVTKRSGVAAGAERMRQIHEAANLGDRNTRAALHELLGASSTKERLSPTPAADPALNAGRYKGTTARQKEDRKIGAKTLGVARIPVVNNLADIAGAGVGALESGVGKIPALAALDAVGVHAPSDIAKNIVHDAGELALGTVPGIYNMGKAGVQALGGNTKPGGDLLHSLRHDSFIGQLLDQKVGDAVQTAHDHPLFSALEFSGAEGAVGRGAGLAARAIPRASGLGKINKLASTERASQKVLGNVELRRSYNPDVIRKGAQVVGERITRRAGGDPNKLTGWRAQRALRQDAHSQSAANEVIRREGREAMRTLTHKLEPQPANAVARRFGAQGKHTDITGLMVQDIVRSPKTLAEDLGHYHNMLEQVAVKSAGLTKRAEGKLTPTEMAANEAMRKSLVSALEDPKFMADPSEHFAAAQAYKTLRNGVDAELQSIGLLTGEQASAKNLPPLIVHEGIRFEHKPVPDAARPILQDWHEAKAAVAWAERKGTSEPALRELRSIEAAAKKELDATGVNPDHVKAGWVTKDGRHLTIDEGLNILDSLGADPAFLTHNPRKLGRFAYFTRSDSRPARTDLRRTGQAVLHGTHDPSWKALSEDIIGATGKLTAANNHDKTLARLGVGDHKGDMFVGPDAWVKAKEFASQLAKDDRHMILRPVRVAPFNERASELEKITDNIGKTGELPNTEELRNLATMFSEAEKKGPGPVLLIHEDVLGDWKKLAGGTQSPNSALVTLRFLTQNFKTTVLPFSVKWFASNHVEGVARSAAYGHGPIDWARGARYMKLLDKYDPELAANFRAHLYAGRLYGSHRRNIVHADRTDVRGTAAEHAVTLSRFVRGLGVGKLRIDTLVHGFNAVAEGIFRFNDFLERQYVTAALGAKLSKQLRETADSNWQASLHMRDMVEHYARDGKVNPNDVRAFEKYADTALGRYSRHSPGERWLIQTFLPFADWYRNALKFVTVTMPKDHPIKQGLIAAYVDAFEEELKQEGQSYSGGLPGFMRGNPAIGSNKFAPLARMLPYGAFSDPGQSAADLVTPQLGGMDVLKGVNWKDKELRDHNGNPITSPVALAGLAAYNAVESQTKGAGLARRLLEGGGSSTDDSTLFSTHVKDGTRRHGGDLANKVFNPFFPIESKPGQGKGQKSVAQHLRDELGIGSSGSAAAELKKALGIPK